MTYKKKLIEVALPLEAINAESAREKSIRHGHPSTLHLWWARRPLATARAVIWSSLVDDPSSHPEKFPTEEAQSKERQRLFDILIDLVKWENSNNESVINAAKAEIMASTGGNPPALFDPFAGGGSIPLEAQRLGLEAYASDLNPVAVMINKAMIEIPPKFAGQRPVNPESRDRMDREAPKGTAGLAEDVRYYGEWMKQEAYKRIGYLYPKSKDEQGNELTVTAWLWARTVKCPNPACGVDMPLVKSFELSKKKGIEYQVEPTLVEQRFKYKVIKGNGSYHGTVERSGAHCLACGSAVGFDYIRSEGMKKNNGSNLIAIIAEGQHGRIYISPYQEHVQAAMVNKPADYPSGVLSGKARVNVSLYGFDETSDLFTNRQLTALSTFSSLVAEAQQKVENDAIEAGMFNDHIPLSEGGTGAKAYGEAIGVYLAFAVDRQANYSSSLNVWGGDFIVQTFGRQALPMVWDYAESNPFSNSTGCWSGAINWVALSIERLPNGILHVADVKQFDAQSDIGYRNVMVSTDPPYYDNIGYADLSDYFYVWMRQALKDTYPKLFRTMLVPKAEELVATPYRFEGKRDKARTFFEQGMLKAFMQVHAYSREDIPVTVYYAYKQSENDGEDVNASTGWETMLNAVIQSGFSITGTWPVRTERETGLKASFNALASSIVLVCKKRRDDAGICTRRDFINTLHRELHPALTKLQSANIAPVDLAQSAIGPGIGVYSRYNAVLEADGIPMSVRSALQIINQQLDAYFNEKDGDLDRDSRFCLDMFSLYAYNDMKFGDADVLARAKGTNIQSLVQKGVLTAAKGLVRLKTWDELPEKVDPQESCIWLLTQQLARTLEISGVKGTASLVRSMLGSNAEQAKALSYRLYTICERKHWAQEGSAYNNLVKAWTEIQSMAARLNAEAPEQMKLNV